MTKRKLRMDAAETATSPPTHLPASRLRQLAVDSAENGESEALAVPGASGPDAPNDVPEPVQEQPHDLERTVQQELISHPAVSFSSLVIRRIEGGLCLEGVLEASSDMPDVDHLVRQVAEVDRVLNRLVVRQPRTGPGSIGSN